MVKSVLQLSLEMIHHFGFS